MTKKKAASNKTTGAKAAAAAKPARPEESVRPPKAPEATTVTSPTPTRPSFRRPQSLNFAGVGRNDICPCGSGKRFKNCHGH